MDRSQDGRWQDGSERESVCKGEKGECVNYGVCVYVCACMCMRVRVN